MVTSKKYKYAKKTKRSRTRRQRHRRRQMRGGGLFDGSSFIDMFKPRVKDTAYCQDEFDKCKANIKSPDSEADSGSSGFLTTFKNLVGIENSTGSVEGKGDDGTTGFEMQEIVPIADNAALANANAAAVDNTLATDTLAVDNTLAANAKLAADATLADDTLVADATLEEREQGGGSRKKYKKRNANSSKKNKNRRNKKRTNKRN